MASSCNAFLYLVDGKSGIAEANTIVAAIEYINLEQIERDYQVHNMAVIKYKIIHETRHNLDAAQLQPEQWATLLESVSIETANWIVKLKKTARIE